MVPQPLHNVERFSCENATEHNLALSAYLPPFIHTSVCFIFARLRFPGQMLTRTCRAAARW